MDSKPCFFVWMKELLAEEWLAVCSEQRELSTDDRGKNPAMRTHYTEGTGGTALYIAVVFCCC